MKAKQREKLPGMDEVLRRMLAAPPQPNKPKRQNKKPAK